MTAVGTWAWAEQTDGRLRRRDRAVLLRQAVAARLSAVHDRNAVALVATAAALPDPPDSALVAAADECARDLSHPLLYGHCLRTWAFAALYAQRDRVEHDPELLYVACVLHDLGLTDAHAAGDGSAGCFAVAGARTAHGLVCAHGTPDQARTVAEAITLHLNVSVPERLGAEAHLLSRGVLLDVVGRGHRQLPRRSVDDVLQRWPRAGSGALLSAATAGEGRRRPASRAAFLGRLGFAGLIAANPLDRLEESASTT